MNLPNSHIAHTQSLQSIASVEWIAGILGVSTCIIVRQTQFGELTASHHNADASGAVNQHLQYLPFGVDFIYQRATGHDIRFKFTGKERDSETGFDYFGARYYSSGLSIWLSDDPMSEERPWLSPYNYCQWNPVMRIDPSGMLDDGFELSGDGYLTWVDDTGADDYDIIYSNNSVGTTNYDKNKALCVEKGVIQNSTQGNYNGNYNQSYTKYELNSHKDGEQFFNFMAKNTNVEWGHTKFQKNKDELSIITTSHEPDIEYGGSDILFIKPDYDDYTLIGHDHSHRNGIWYPSGSDQEILYNGVRYYDGDINFVHELELCIPNSFKARIYDLKNDSYFEYDSKFYYNPRDLPAFEVKAQKKQ